VWSLADDAVSSLYASLDDDTTAAAAATAPAAAARCRCGRASRPQVPAEDRPEPRADPGRRPLVMGRLLLIVGRFPPDADCGRSTDVWTTVGDAANRNINQSVYSRNGRTTTDIAMKRTLI